MRVPAAERAPDAGLAEPRPGAAGRPRVSPAAGFRRSLLPPDRPARLFLHHTPFKAGHWHMERQNLLKADELAPIVRRHPRVQLIATGHVHRATLTMFAGVPTTICPAPNHAVDLDLAELREPSFRVEPPAFHLHSWFPGEGFGTVITHQIPIGTFDGPHPFFGPDGKLL